MLSVLINERTGTTVNVIQRDDLNACHQALMQGKADIYISYLGLARDTAGATVDLNDSQKAYTVIKRSYLDRFGMVWLRPFGFRGPVTSEKSPDEKGLSLAAPIAGKEVLRQFPVLDRVINKLAGRVDDSAMSALAKQVETQDVREAVKQFLKARNLI